MKLRIAACLSLLITSPTLVAEPVTADRPGYSTGTATVRPGHFNVELGYQGSSGSHSFPLTNVRIGLTPVTEIDLQWSGWDTATGDIGNLTLGGKYRLLDGDALQLSLLGLFTLPSGNSHPAGAGIAPFGALLWSYAAYEQAGLFGTLQIASSDPAALQTRFQAAVGAAFEHTPQLGSYLELFADLPLNHAGNDSFVLDGGFTWLLDERTQLDLHLGIDINGHAADFIGIGVARSY